jgi:type IV pilus assembly protein PilO
VNFLEQLRKLDANDIGRWPLLFRALLIGILFVAVVGGGTYVWVVRSQLPDLDRAEKKELELKATFEAKQRKAANFDAYKAQLDDMQRSFGAMLRQLPGKTEVPNLLVDISQTGLAAGLEEQLFQPSPEVRRDFYAELPIRIRLLGTYHELGSFVSGIAALPRIVTLHDIEIKPAGKDSYDNLVLDLTAKTYRYLDEEEQATTAAPAPAGGG